MPGQLVVELVDDMLGLAQSALFTRGGLVGRGDLERLFAVGFFGGDPSLDAVFIPKAGRPVLRLWVLKKTGHG